MLWIKRVDACKNYSFSTLYGKGAGLVSLPNLPHGPNGIIVGYDTIIGSNCTIYHKITISWVEIGDDVILGAGAKVLPGVKIGNGAKVGANCVVVEDVPKGATVVLHKSRIIKKSSYNLTE